MNPAMRTRRPFFIVGTGRSGTTLLQAMFMSAPGVFIPPETHFLPIARSAARRRGPVRTDRGLDGLVAEVLAMCARQQMPVDPRELERELRAAPRTVAGLFDALLAHVQERHPGCRRIGEKSPVHLPFVPEILDMFPDAQAITIIRDGRDVALSHERSLGRNTLRTAFRWRADQRMHARYARTLPAERYASVRYEDLVAEPEAQLRRLCAFLGEDFCEAMLRPHERAEEGFADWETHKALTRQPVTTSRIGRYRSQLSPAKIALFQRIAGRELVGHGYALDRVPPSCGWVLAVLQFPELLLARFGHPGGMGCM